MTKPQQLRFKALCRVEDVCNEHSAFLDTIPEAVIERANLHDCILKLNNANEIIISNLKPIAATKAICQNEMIDTVFKYMNRASIKAGQEGKLKLKLSLTLSRYKLTQNSDCNIETIIKEKKELMKKNLGILTNLDNSAILEMENAILAYNQYGTAPKDSRVNRKALGTDTLAKLLNQGDVHKANMIKIFHSYLPEHAPYIEALAKIGKHTGIRHISIAIQVVIAHTNIPLKNVKCTITNSSDTIVHYSTVRGWVKFFSLNNSIWNITIEYPTYKTVFQLNVPAFEGKITRLRFDLEKIQ